MPDPKTHPLTRRLLNRPRRKRSKRRKRRLLKFSPYAWAKLIWYLPKTELTDDFSDRRRCHRSAGCSAAEIAWSASNTTGRF